MRASSNTRTRFSSSGLDYEIIVCDDGSTDRTGAVADHIAGTYPRIRVLHHKRNQGIRATFEQLYHEATKEFVFLNSTDGQWDTAALFDLLPDTRNFDVIVAARRHKHYRPIRALVSWGFNLLARLIFGMHSHDAGAVKLMRREIIERFELVSTSPFNEAERLIRATRAGYRVIDRPTDTKPRAQGQSRGASGTLVTAALLDVLRVWRALRRESRRPLPADSSVRDSSHADRS